MGYNEADTRAKLINPKLHEAGWSEDLIRREITAGTESQKEKKGQVLRFILSTNIYTYTQCLFSGEVGKMLGKRVTLKIDSVAHDEYSPTGILFYDAVT